MSYFKNFVVLLFSVNCFAADQQHGSWLSNTVAGCVTAMVLYKDWQVQRHVCTDVSYDTVIIDSDGKTGAAFAYSPHQRTVAIERQKAIITGAMNCARFVVSPVRSFESRAVLNPSSLAEYAVLPVALYNALRPAADILIPQVPYIWRSLTIAILSTHLIPPAIVATGASPERVVACSLMSNFCADNHNLCRDVAYVRQIAQSLAYASKVMPIVQLAVSHFYKKSSMLTVHPVFYTMGGINTNAEYIHGVIPALILAGVDFGFNAVARTPVGVAVEAGVDAVLDRAVAPLSEVARARVRRGTKKIMAETVKIGAATALIGAAESQGCVIS